MKHRNRWKAIRIGVYVFLMLSLAGVMLLPSNSPGAETKSHIYVIPVEDDISKGLHAFLQRAFRDAANEGIDHILLEMDTYGGAVDAADDIGKLLQETRIPITVFVNNSAISAGAFIALNADAILMVPTAKMGAATVVDMEGNAGDAKAMSMWIQAMRAAAEQSNRDPLYAEAMVDPLIEIEGLISKDRPLTFSASTALEYGYAEAIVNTREEALAFLGLENATITEVEITFAENVARFITNPIVVSILFSLASIGLIVELYSPGFGIPGLIGLASLFLFFFGHMVAGFAGWESVLLFVVGLALILIDIFTAGFGLFGIVGILSIVVSLIMASADVIAGLQAMGIALIFSIITLIILIGVLGKKGFWVKLVLQDTLEHNEGKAQFEKKSELLGKKGVTLTPLRPSGTVKIGNLRYDVVSAGSFIDIHQPIEVIDVKGTRILVVEDRSAE